VAAVFLFAAGFGILIAVRGATAVAGAFGRWLLAGRAARRWRQWEQC
jgi:hypothetical protein